MTTTSAFAGQARTEREDAFTGCATPSEREKTTTKQATLESFMQTKVPIRYERARCHLGVAQKHDRSPALCLARHFVPVIAVEGAGASHTMPLSPCR